MEAFGNEHKESIIKELKEAGYSPKSEQPSAVYQ
jgi:threonine dehydratase